MNIQRDIYFRAQHVTGPKCVLVSVKFGKTPPDGPYIIRRLAMDRKDASVAFDLENYIRELMAGVSRANSEHRGDLEVEAIEVVPDDYPGTGQVEHVAYKIASAVLTLQSSGTRHEATSVNISGGQRRAFDLLQNFVATSKVSLRVQAL